MHSWCNGYHHKKWAWQPKFKSWMKLFTIYTMLIHLVKISIQLFSLPLCVNNREDWLFYLSMATSLREGKLNSNLLNLYLKIGVVSHHAHVERLGKYIYIYICHRFFFKHVLFNTTDKDNLLNFSNMPQI